MKRLLSSLPFSTGLKPGVNEKRDRKCEISGLNPNSEIEMKTERKSMFRGIRRWRVVFGVAPETSSANFHPLEIPGSRFGESSGANAPHSGF